MGDAGLDRFGGGDVGAADNSIAFLEFGDATPVERTRQLWPDFQRSSVIRDSVVKLSEFQISEAAAVKIKCIAWLKLKRLRAIR